MDQKKYWLSQLSRILSHLCFQHIVRQATTGASLRMPPVKPVQMESISLKLGREYVQTVHLATVLQTGDQPLLACAFVSVCVFNFQEN